MNKIIFLDIDGCLALNYSRKTSFKLPSGDKVPYGYEPKCCNIINEILDKTDAKIVLSSDWKIHYNLGELKYIFKHNGINPDKLIATTVDYSNGLNSDDVSTRTYQINEYIKDNGIEKYVVIDDMNLNSFNDKFIYCNTKLGIAEPLLKERIIELLN